MRIFTWKKQFWLRKSSVQLCYLEVRKNSLCVADPLFILPCLEPVREFHTPPESIQPHLD